MTLTTSTSLVPVINPLESLLSLYIKALDTQNPLASTQQVDEFAASKNIDKEIVFKVKSHLQALITAYLAAYHLHREFNNNEYLEQFSIWIATNDRSFKPAEIEWVRAYVPRTYAELCRQYPATIHKVNEYGVTSKMQRVQKQSPFHQGDKVTVPFTRPEKAAPTTPPSSAIVYAAPTPLALSERELRLGHEIVGCLSRIAGIERKFELVGQPTKGPRVIEYRIRQAEDGQTILPVGRIAALADTFRVYVSQISEVSQCGAVSIRPRTGYIAVEIPVDVPDDWSGIPLTYAIRQQTYNPLTQPYKVPIGLDTSGSIVELNLSKRVSAHIGVGGGTGGGKNGFLDTLIFGSMLKYGPDYVQFLLIDLQDGVNFKKFNDLPWLWWNRSVVKDPADVISSLAEVHAEAKRRLQLFGQHDVEEINEYNRLAAINNWEPLYHLNIVIDELALVRTIDQVNFDDDMHRGTKEYGKLGLHYVLSTQRFDRRGGKQGVMDAGTAQNLGVRVCFKTENEANSKLILGEEYGMANKLAGMGDAYVLKPGLPEPLRVQVFKADKVEHIEAAVKQWQSPKYAPRLESMIPRPLLKVRAA